MAAPTRRLIASCCSRNLNVLALPRKHGTATRFLQPILQTRYFSPSTSLGVGKSSKGGSNKNNVDTIIERMGKSLQEPAGLLYGKEELDEDNTEGHRSFIPQVSLHGYDGRNQKRVLV